MLKLLEILWQNHVINNFCQLVDPELIRQELSRMKALNVDGVIVNCWWGIVEGWNPQKYAWSGYRELFNIIREFNLKVQVVFHCLLETLFIYLSAHRADLSI